jgi:hypothetical protein
MAVRDGCGAAWSAGGTLDDPPFVAPDVHIFTRSKQLPWVVLPEGVPALELPYDTNAVAGEELGAAAGGAAG